MDRNPRRSVFASRVLLLAAPFMTASVLLTGVLPLAGVAWPAVIHVPEDQPTIQTGLDAAAEGDTVMVGGIKRPK